MRHVYLILVVMVGWVFFRADSLPQALSYLATMADLRGFRAPDAALAILTNAQAVGALYPGVALRVPIAAAGPGAPTRAPRRAARIRNCRAPGHP